MAIYKPSELHAFLNTLGIAPKKGLSQNFLIDGNIIRKIVKAADVQPGDLVLEIGPGPGSLTQALLEAQAHVIAVEKDATLAIALERLKGPNHQLEVFCDDILTFPLEATLAPYLAQGKKIKVIANLPYHLTTPIIAQLIVKNSLFSSLVIMVQEEVARRFIGKPGTKEYGSFTVFLDFYSQPSYAFFVSRHCFYPPPSVDSAVVALHLKETIPLLPQEASTFFEMTRTAFEHRRKMLRSSLRSLFDPLFISEALMKIGQDPLARPEKLSLNDFLELYHSLKELS
jgi:16S rRNA (adenine1518-N6/adenine1519-N6)-dimethyltransferase